MGIQIISTYLGVLNYIEELKRAPKEEPKTTWLKHIVEPQWHLWAEGQFNEARIKGEVSTPITDINKLQEAFDAICTIDIDSQIRKAYEQSTTLLPSPEDDISVAVFLDISIGADVHGVVGSCVGDNIMLKVNPLVKGWDKYLTWVIAHEYHHTVWGYNYFFIKGNRSMTLLTALLSEGQADSFAATVTGEDLPNWLNCVPLEEEVKQWDIIQNYLQLEHGPELHNRFFFGDHKTDTPKYVGYAIGYKIVQRYQSGNPTLSYKELLDKDEMEIFAESNKSRF